MQKRQIIIIAISVVLGLIAAAMIMMQIREVSEAERSKALRALEQIKQNQAVIMLAKQDIAAGTVIQASMLESGIVPREHVQPQAATSLDSVAGMVAVAPILQGEQVSLTKLSAASRMPSKPRDLASITPPGKRAVVLSAENIEDLIGLIRPGDYIDIIAILSVPGEEGEKEAKKKGEGEAKQMIVPAFQNVLVLAVGQETHPQAVAKERAKDKAQIITVALSPTEANILTFLQEQGAVRISLRSQQDSQIEVAKPITWENIHQYLPALKGEKGTEETIEIYRGLNKEKIPVSE